MTPAKVQKIQKDLVSTIDALKKNFPMYKAAKDSGDEKKLKKHRDIALKLTKKKKELETKMDSALGGLYKDAELELKESISRSRVIEIIKEEVAALKEANPDGTISDDEDEDMEKLLEDIESRMEDILYEADQETRRIGGKFRQPGYKVQIVKLLTKMIEGFAKGERF